MKCSKNQERDRQTEYVTEHDAAFRDTATTNGRDDDDDGRDDDSKDDDDGCGGEPLTTTLS